MQGSKEEYDRLENIKVIALYAFAISNLLGCVLVFVAVYVSIFLLVRRNQFS